MKNKVYSSKFASFFSLIVICILMVIEIVNICLLINDIINKNNILFEIIMIIGFLPFVILILFYANRFGYIVVYDSKNNILRRKGLICGYKSQVKIDDIKDIIIATFPKETTYYIFIDSNNIKYDGGSKNSFIRIEKNDKNLNFIRQFWNKPIKNK